MSFSYDPHTPIGKIRLAIGDTRDATVQHGAGVRPDGSNFSDEEIQVFLAINPWYRVVPILLRILAGEYASLPTRTTLSDFSEDYAQKCEDLLRLAAEWERFNPENPNLTIAIAWADDAPDDAHQLLANMRQLFPPTTGHAA